MPSPFIESIRQQIKVRHYSLKTEKSYLFWIRQFIRFNKMKPPKDTETCQILTLKLFFLT
ncbi:phage integrase N-terminal SAM-like domain-containing protein [Vibrio sp. S11_S32]|uniref:phage integrase N-terminal SAM-like domain-containing protein n=1 Tax=Vibrio sp. S11_S32 TaxID=2720225 RepID=UPI001931C9E5